MLLPCQDWGSASQSSNESTPTLQHNVITCNGGTSAELIADDPIVEKRFSNLTAFCQPYWEQTGNMYKKKCTVTSN